MSRSRWLVLVPFVVAVALGGLSIGRALGGDAASTTIDVTRADDQTAFEHDVRIPPGTADRIAAGVEVEIVPAELVVEVGDAIRIVNDDREDHVVGVFFVAAGETLTQRFDSEGVLAGECSVHSSGSFTLRVVA